MNLGNFFSKADLWLLDRVFQPLADRLPERLPAIELGLSMLFGALMLSGASIAAMVFFAGMAVTDAIFNALVWACGLSFYVGINRMKVVVRAGQANPLRVMLLGMRLISVPFAVYAFYQCITASAVLEIPFWFNSLGNIVFVVGIYLVSCQPSPPKKRQVVWGKSLTEVREGA